MPEQAPPLTEFEAKFARKVVERLSAAKAYAPFLAVRNIIVPPEHDGLRYARAILAAPHPTDDFMELWSAGYTAMTVEALIAEPEWASLFSRSERNVARGRIGEPLEPDEDGTGLAELTTKFAGRMLALCDAVRLELRYDAVWFRRMVERDGGVETARQLLARPDPSGGFGEFRERGRPDLCVESLILETQYAPLFTDAELAIARERLGR